MRSALDAQQTWATFKDWLMRLYDHTADFDLRYYGPSVENPIINPLGGAIKAGDLYFNTANNLMMTYRAGAWVAYEAAAKTSADASQVSAAASELSHQASVVAADASEVSRRASVDAAASVVSLVQPAVNSATASAETATTQAGLASAAKTAAETARDASNVNGKIYATAAAGLAAVASGSYFSVPSAESTEYLILYLNNAGAAFEQKRYKSAAGVDAVINILVQQRTELITQDGASIYNPVTNVTGQIRFATGVVETGGGGSCSDFMPVVGGYPVTFGLNMTTGYDWGGLAFYDASKVYISGVVGGQDIGSVVTPPMSAKFLRIGTNNADTAWLTGKIYVGSRSSAKAAEITANYDQDFANTAYAHEIVGLNVYNTATLRNGFIKSDAGLLDTGGFSNGGLPWSGTSYTATDFMPIAPGIAFYYTAPVNGINASSGTAFYDKNQNFISGIGDNMPAYTVMHAPPRARFFRMCSIMAGEWVGAEIILGPIWADKKRKGGQWAGKNVIDLGDSISSSNWLSPLFADMGMTLKYNAAYPGRTTARALYKGDNTTLLTAPDFADVDLCFYYLGVNNDPANVGSMSSALDSGTFYGDTRNVIETIMGWNPKCRIVLSTLCYSSVRVAEVAAFNPAIKAIAAYYAIPLFDLNALSGISPFNIATMTADGLHPTTAGYSRGLTPSLKGFLRSIDPVK